MIRIFQAFSSLQNYTELAKKCCIQNKLSPAIIAPLNLQKASTVYCQILEMYKLWPTKAEKEWFQNELKLFYWTLIVESFFKKKPIEDFNQNDWQLIRSYFTPKSLLVLQYQYRKLLLKTDQDSYCLWDQLEKQSLIKIMNQNVQPYPWQDIARSLFQLLGKNSVKTSKQCREHWYNHLDPTKKHGQWKSEQDLQIVHFALKNGHKWSLLCKNVFSHRTEHMVKNRFNSIVKKYKDGQMYSAANQRKILKRIAKRLEAKVDQTPVLGKKAAQLSSGLEENKVRSNQITEVKSYTSNNSAQHQNLATLSSQQKHSAHLQLAAAVLPVRSNAALEGDNSLNYNYNFGISPIIANVFSPASFISHFPLWQQPSFYWFGPQA